MAETFEAYLPNGTIRARVVGAHRSCTVVAACFHHGEPRPSVDHPKLPVHGYLYITQNPRVNPLHEPKKGRRYGWSLTYEGACSAALKWANRKAR